MSKMTPNEIHRLSGSLDRIKRLDETIDSIAGRIEDDCDKWGEGVRNVFGRNRMDKWRNNFLGQVVATAIINELLKERDEMAGDLDGVVEPPPRPMIDQIPDRDLR